MILQPLGISRVEVGSLGLQESKPQQQLPKAPDNPAACTHPWAASQALTKSSKGHTLSLQPPSLAPGELERYGPRQWGFLEGRGLRL